MAVASQVTAVVKADISDLKVKYGEAKAETTSMADHVSASSASLFSQIKGFLIGAGIIDAVYQISDAFKSLISTGIDYNMSLQMLQAQLKAITGSNSAAVDLLNWAKQFGQTVPDTTENLDKAIVTIESLGMNAKQVLPPLANIAAAMGVDLPTAAQAFADATEGRFTMMMMELHVTKDELVKYGLDVHNIAGTIVTALTNLSNAKFSTGTKDAMETFKGQLTNLTDRFQIFAGMLTKPIFDLLQKGLMDLFGFLDAHKDLVSALATNLGQGLANGLQAVGSILSQIGPTLQQFFGLLGGATSGMNFGGIAASFQAFAQTIQAQVLPVATQFASWFQSQLLPAIQSVQPSIQSFGNFIVNVVAPALIQFEAGAAKVGIAVGSLLLPIFEKIEPILVRVAGWLLGMAQQALAFLIPKVNEAMQAISQFATEMSTRLAPFIDKLTTGIQFAADIISKLWTALWPTMAAVLKYAWDLISNIIKTAWDLITGIFKIGADLLSGNWGQLWKDILGLVGSVGQDIKNTIFTWLGDLGNIIAQSPVGQYFSNFIIEPIKNAVKAAIGWIEGLWQAFIDWITGTGGKAAPNPTSSGNYKGGKGFASGGMTSSDWMRMNEQGGEMVKLPNNSYVYPAGQFPPELLASLREALGRGGGHTFNFYGVYDPGPISDAVGLMLKKELLLHGS